MIGHPPIKSHPLPMNHSNDRNCDGFLLDDHLVLPSQETYDDFFWSTPPVPPMVWEPPSNETNIANVPYSQDIGAQQAMNDLIAQQLPAFINQQSNIIQKVSSCLVDAKVLYERLCSVISIFHYLRMHPELLEKDHSKYPVIMTQIADFRKRSDANKRELHALTYIRKYIAEIHHTLSGNHMILVSLDGSIAIQEKIQQKFTALMRHVNGVELIILKNTALEKKA